MRKTSVAAIMVLLSAVANAQTPATTPPHQDTWFVLRFTDGAMAWNRDAGKWNQAGDTIEGHRLVYYSKPQVVDGESVTWKQDFWKIVCPANTIEIKSGEELGANLQTLFQISSAKPYAIKENSSDYFLKLVYCDNRMIQGATEAKGILGVMETMSKPAQ